MVVEYETPPEPGSILLESTPQTTVVEQDEDVEDAEADGDADGDESAALTNLAEKDAYFRRYVRVHGDHVASPQNGRNGNGFVAAGKDETVVMNDNGKRPLEGSRGGGGRPAKGARVLREK